MRFLVTTEHSDSAIDTVEKTWERTRTNDYSGPLRDKKGIYNTLNQTNQEGRILHEITEFAAGPPVVIFCPPKVPGTARCIVTSIVQSIQELV